MGDEPSQILHSDRNEPGGCNHAVAARATVSIALSGLGEPLLQPLARRNFDAEAGKADIGHRPWRAQADRGDPEIAQDLGAETDFAPFPGALGLGIGLLHSGGIDRNTRCTVAQKDKHPAAVFLELREGLADAVAARDHIGDNIDPMQPCGNIAAIANVALDEGEMLHRIKRRDIGIAGKRTAGADDLKRLDALDDFFACLAMRDEIGDRNAL